LNGVVDRVVVGTKLSQPTNGRRFALLHYPSAECFWIV
jgi:hypothetical protein